MMALKAPQTALDGVENGHGPTGHGPAGHAAAWPERVRFFLRRRLAELAGLVLLGLAAGFFAALISARPTDPGWNHARPGATENWLGAAGAGLADISFQFFGLAVFLLPLLLAAWGGWLAAHMRISRPAGRAVLGLLAALLAAGALASLHGANALSATGSFPAGLGGFVGERLHALGADILDRSVNINDPQSALPGGGEGVAGALFALAGLAGLAAALPGLAPGAVRMLWWMMKALARIAGRAFKVAGARRAGGDASPLRTALRNLERGAPEAGTRTMPGAGDPSGARVPGASVPGASVSGAGVSGAGVSGASVPGAGGAGRTGGGKRPPAGRLPPLSLLAPDSETAGGAKSVSRRLIEETAAQLSSVLEDFGIQGEIKAASTGPVVTLYEFEPAPGVKSARIISLADDIARSMSALSARIAGIPGRNVIGIELPNPGRQTVALRGLLSHMLAAEPERHDLPLALGQTIGGAPVITDLARMPHLLVAGTTGSGKSVAINAMILSLLYRFRPQECRLIMIDPKRLELSVYEGIGHLLAPVVTEPKKAVAALKWTVREMERRYQQMSEWGVRNIAGYNERVRRAGGKAEPMPFIVVILDEMADLMILAGKEIEAALQRLAQMARAAGIHLITATQRPSVDVITGTIKANFPTRISFQVSSKIDSRTILGEAGAEQLLGQGDMLFMAAGGRVRRVHGALVRDRDVEAVADFLRRSGAPDYREEITAEPDRAEEAEMMLEDGGDLYVQAVAVVTEARRASTSFLQRKLQIGYNRAARLIEQMEAEGIVTPPNHSGKREVLERGA